jgi:hypothetical protein
MKKQTFRPINIKWRDHFGGLGVDGRIIILKWILEKWGERG